MLTRFGILTLASLVLGGCAAAPVEESASSTSELSSRPDGEPDRKPCTETFGNGLSGMAGRLDGTIVAVVLPRAPGQSQVCRSDRTHVHLQVLAQGGVYDISVNVNGGYVAEKDVNLVGGDWEDGWHRGVDLDYARDWDLHASDFDDANQADLTAHFERALADANHVSVYGTLFNRGGLHLIHRVRVPERGSDGAVVLKPLSKRGHVFAFRFGHQEF